MENNKLPPEILDPLLEAREVWGRHAYLTVPRSMVDIDIALDAMNEYFANVRRFEEFLTHYDGLLQESSDE